VPTWTTTKPPATRLAAMADGRRSIASSVRRSRASAAIEHPPMNSPYTCPVTNNRRLCNTSRPVKFGDDDGGGGGGGEFPAAEVDVNDAGDGHADDDTRAGLYLYVGLAEAERL